MVGYICLYMVIYGYIWLYMVFHNDDYGYIWFSTMMIIVTDGY